MIEQIFLRTNDAYYKIYVLKVFESDFFFPFQRDYLQATYKYKVNISVKRRLKYRNYYCAAVKHFFVIRNLYF